MKKKYVIIIVIISTLLSCKKKSYKIYNNNDLNYPKFYQIFSKTDFLKKENEFIKTMRNKEKMRFYRKKIDELYKQAIKVWNKPEELFPKSKFDSVYFVKNVFKNRKLNTREIIKLLAILNNPLNFTWDEKTVTPSYKLVFKLKNKTVAKVKLSNCFGYLKHNLTWEKYKLMKFGALKPDKRNELKHLLDF